MCAFSYAWSLQSRDKDGGHTIQSAKAKKTDETCIANFMAQSFIELEL